MGLPECSKAHSEVPAATEDRMLQFHAIVTDLVFGQSKLSAVCTILKLINQFSHYAEQFNFIFKPLKICEYLTEGCGTNVSATSWPC